MSASDDILDRILKEIHSDPTRRSRSELSYARGGHPGERRDPRSRKPLQKAFWGQHRGPHAREEIESQLSEMDSETELFLDTATIADLVPIGKEDFNYLDVEEFLQDPVTGQSHRISKQTLYLSKLARDIVQGDLDMPSEYIDKLIQLSPEFESSLDDAYSDSYGIGRFEDEPIARLAETRRGPRGTDTRIAEKFGSADVRQYFKWGILDRHDTAEERGPHAERGLIASRRRGGLLSETTIDYGSDTVDEETLVLMAHVILAGCEVIFSKNLSESEEYNYGQELRYLMAGYPRAVNVINDVVTEIRTGGGFDDLDSYPSEEVDVEELEED